MSYKIAVHVIFPTSWVGLSDSHHASVRDSIVVQVCAFEGIATMIRYDYFAPSSSLYTTQQYLQDQNSVTPEQYKTETRQGEYTASCKVTEMYSPVAMDLLLHKCG